MLSSKVSDWVDGVIVPHIDMAQARVGIQQGAADAHVSVPLAQVIHRPVDSLPLVAPLILRVEGHLDGADSLHYRALLSRLTLAPDHRENLLRRGLTDEAIERLGYKSTPVVGFHALAQSLLDEGYTLFGVPGFYRDEDGRWTMAVWRRGILIPGTYLGKIQGFQIRLDNKMKKGGKFLTFSSRDELDGAMGENWCHLVGPLRERILLIEGYMKADIVNYFTGQTMLAIPGVTSLQHLEAALRDLIPLGVRHVMTCFDMDYLKNWHVENAYRNLVALLGKQDITFGTYLWLPDHNGLDDYIWEFCMNQGKAPE